MDLSPVGLISSMDRALHPVIAKVRVRFPVKPEFLQVLFQPFRLFIQLRGSFLPLLTFMSQFHISIRNTFSVVVLDGGFDGGSG